MKSTEDKKYYDRLSEPENESLGYYLKTLLIYVIIGCVILATAYLFPSCESSTINEEPAQDKSFYWQTRHDAIPEQFKGEWVSISDKTEIVLIVTDRYIMTKDFTIDREQDNVVKVNEGVLHMYQNGKFYALAFGGNGALTITAYNECYDTVLPFQQQQTNLN